MKTRITYNGRLLTVEHSAGRIVDVRDSEGRFVSLNLKNQNRLMGKINQKRNDMKEIKFRAKIWDSEEWVYGGGVEFFNDHAVLLGKDEKGRLTVYKVISETVGEYTGLKDRNGKEIYEGDILYFPEADEKVDVIFDDGAFNVLFSFDYGRTILTNGLLDANYDVEVISNIYENPDLISNAQEN